MTKYSNIPFDITVPPLRAVRIAQGLSLEDCAAEAGIDVSRLSRIERGKSQPTVANLVALARVLGLRDLERLLRPYAPTNADGAAHRRV